MTHNLALLVMKSQITLMLYLYENVCCEFWYIGEKKMCSEKLFQLCSRLLHEKNFFEICLFNDSVI